MRETLVQNLEIHSRKMELNQVLLVSLNDQNQYSIHILILNALLDGDLENVIDFIEGVARPYIITTTSVCV